MSAGPAAYPCPPRAWPPAPRPVGATPSGTTADQDERRPGIVASPIESARRIPVGKKNPKSMPNGKIIPMEIAIFLAIETVIIAPISPEAATER
jgi:hypothetical protein